MQIRKAVFTISAANYAGCPPVRFPEYAFVGRSNVGKSSLINMLTGIGNLARTSADPGKTRLLNYFLIDESWYLVDLPGYGYARISKDKRKGWDAMVREYLESRESLFYTFLLIDSRLEPQAKDLRFLDWLGEKGLPCCIVFTKADKLSKNKLQHTIGAFKAYIQEKWEELPPTFTTSSHNGAGKMEILDFIEQANKEYAHLLPVIGKPSI
ncbi:MAG: YihA family ribosome biogenesis GTP-binding protein [Bacteroidales bacterium]|nr:YihA family ribosome biogenesis GTP-binding protein [Bacteroidales bacterium]